jgi:hypothetical protein
VLSVPLLPPEPLLPPAPWSGCDPVSLGTLVLSSDDPEPVPPGILVLSFDDPEPVPLVPPLPPVPGAVLPPDKLL